VPERDDDDTWPPADAPYRAELIVGDRRLAPAVRDALSGYLSVARSAVLDHDTSAVRAAVGPDDDLEPNLDAWPPRSVWDELVSQFVVPASEDVWYDGWLTQLTSAQATIVDDATYRAAHLADTTVRFTNATWPDHVYDVVRQAITESVEADETPGEVRERVAEALSMDKWSPTAEVIARNELHAALSTGAYHAGLARQDVFEETLYKQWLATSDTRTRPAHRRANGAVVASAEAFVVDGEHLQYPHDPTGSADNTIQCRCAVTWLDETEVDAAREQYAEYLANLDREGSPVVPTKATNKAVAAAAAGKVTVTRGRAASPSTGRRLGTRGMIDLDALAAFAGNTGSGDSGGDNADAGDGQDSAGDGQDSGDIETAKNTGYWAGPLLALDHLTGDSSIFPRIVGSQDTYRATNHNWLSYQRESQPGHFGKVAVGRPEVLWIAPADLDGQQIDHLWGAGSFDVSDPDVPEIVRKLADGYAGTVSADLDSARADLRWFDEDGNETEEPDFDQFWDWLEGVDIGKEPAEFIYQWRFAGVTQVQDPAFHTGWIRLSTTSPEEWAAKVNPVWQLDFSSIGTITAALTASASGRGPKVTAKPGTRLWCEQVAADVPHDPPASHFTNPQLTGPTKVTVTSDRRVFGHIADWETLHAVHDIPPPRCQYGGTYPKFHRHPVTCSDGTMVLTGPLATGGHADDDDEVTFADAVAHYDNPNYVLADVVAGEDEFGIWVSGALRPGVSPSQVLFAYRYSFSGDWRDEALIAACSCSTPAFHLAHDQTVVAMVASAGADRPKLASSQTRMRRHRNGALAVLTASGVIPPDTGRPLPDRTRGRRTTTAAAGITGHQLYRDFKQAQQADASMTAAARRVRGRNLDAAATRVREGR
jgi:hypothetical protein